MTDEGDLKLYTQVNKDDPTKVELVFQGVYSASSKSISSYPAYNVSGGLQDGGSINVISTTQVG